MPVINTESPAYQTYLTRLIQIHTLFRDTYGPYLKKMTKPQLIALYQRDPIFKEIVDMSKDISWLADKVGVEL